MSTGNFATPGKFHAIETVALRGVSELDAEASGRTELA
jgi:hypothetical protein